MNRQIFPGIPCRFEIVWCDRDFCWYTPYWRRWKLRWRRHCISVRYPCGVRISTLGRVGLVNANFPRRKIYHFPGLSMKCDSEISASGKIKSELSTTIDVNGLMSALDIYDPRLKAQVEGKTVKIEPVLSIDRLPKLEPLSSLTPWKYYWEFRRRNPGPGATTISSTRLYDLKSKKAAVLLNGIALSPANGAYFKGGDWETAPYIDFEDFLIASPCTFELYYNFSGSTPWERLIDFGDGPAMNPPNDNFVIARYRESNTLNILGSHKGSWRWRIHEYITGGSLANTENHLVVTIDSQKNLKIYLNNVLVGSSTEKYILNPKGGSRKNNWMGRSNFPSTDNLEGYIKYFRFWDKGIDEKDVSLLFQFTKLKISTKILFGLNLLLLNLLLILSIYIFINSNIINCLRNSYFRETLIYSSCSFR